MDMSFTALLKSMSWPALLVVLIMAIMSVVSLWVMIERFMTFQQAKNQSLKLLGALSNVLTKGDYQQAIDILLEFEAVRRDKRNTDPEVAIEASRQGMDRTAMITVAELKENLGALATIGATAPFVGLFGTVLGIIHAFGKMATSGGGIASVSAGIAEALITTAFGLAVAIPAVWAYNYFQNRVDRFTVEMSNSGSEMSIYFLKEVGAGHEKSVA